MKDHKYLVTKKQDDDDDKSDHIREILVEACEAHGVEVDDDDLLVTKLLVGNTYTGKGMKVLRTENEVVTFTEVEHSSATYRRYGFQSWRIQLEDGWYEIDEARSYELEKLWNDAMKAMGRGSGKTAMTVAKMTPPPVYKIGHLRYLAERAIDFMERFNNHRGPTEIGVIVPSIDELIGQAIGFYEEDQE